MSCVNGDLRQVIFNGKNDFIFKIPNFCICDPIFERDYDEIKNNDENIIQKNIIIIICYRNDKNDNNRRFNDEDYSSEEDVLDFDEYQSK